MDEKIESGGPELIEFQALQHCFGQVHLTVEPKVRLFGPVNQRPVIERPEADRAFRFWHQRPIDIARDRGVENTAAARICVGRHISPAPTEA